MTISTLTRFERVALAAIAALTALAGIANYGHWAPVPRFAVATLALAGLAWIVSFGTEQLGERFGPAVTGLLQSTLGNLPELFVVIFALDKGEKVVAQTAIVGSILANALLVLGLVIVVGGCPLRGRGDALLQAPAARHRDAAAGRVFIIVMLGLSLDPASEPPRRRRSRSSVRSACWSSTSHGSSRTCAPTFGRSRRRPAREPARWPAPARRRAAAARCARARASACR